MSRRWSRAHPSGMHVAHRVRSLRPYLSARLQERVAAARAEGIDLISLASGTHDLPTPSFIVAELAAAARDPATHRYPDFYGLRGFRVAIAAHYRRRFGVELDPDTQVLPLIGGKEGIAHLPWAVVDPGDRVLVPDPAYPVYETGAALAGGIPVRMPLRKELGWLPDFDALDPGGARLAWLNYPNNPTGAVAEPAGLARAVRFATEHGLLLAYDNAYSEICFDGYRAPSILSIPGAVDVAVEFGSMSKTYNMAGWRVGWMVGNPVVVEALGRLKTNLDSGIFTAIQRAAIAALERGAPAVARLTAVYRQRRDRLVELCAELGWPVDPPRGGIYVWVPTPAGEPSEEFAARLVEEAGVLVTPGVSYGPGGEGHVRLSLAVPEQRLREACRRLTPQLFRPMPSGRRAQNALDQQEATW